MFRWHAFDDITEANLAQIPIELYTDDPDKVVVSDNTSGFRILQHTILLVPSNINLGNSMKNYFTVEEIL